MSCSGKQGRRDCLGIENLAVKNNLAVTDKIQALIKKFELIAVWMDSSKKNDFWLMHISRNQLPGEDDGS